MIFYGTGSSKGKTALTGNHTCPNCKVQGPFFYQCINRYAHIFWIPLVPFQKMVVAQCIKCKTVFDSKSFDPSMREAAGALRNSQKYSIFHFSGLILLAGLFIWSSLPESEKTKKEKQLAKEKQQELFQSKLDNPQVNNIFYADYGDTTIDGKNYRQNLVLKVVNSTLDSVDFQISNLMKMERKLGSGFSSTAITDEFFAAENVLPMLVRESKEKLSNKLIFGNLTILKV